MKTNGFACALFSVLLAATGCGSSSTSPASYTYSSTSTVGDYAEWTITGSSLTVTWNVTDSNGAITKTFHVAADCGSPDATYGYRSCTITSSSCTDGTTTCGASDAPSGSFKMLDVPGVALFVQIGDGVTHPAELHVGLLKDAGSCGANVTGDYPYVRIGLGQKDIFGMYSTNSDLTDVTHADFQMQAANQTTTPTLVYATVDPPSGPPYSGHMTFATTCNAGVRTLPEGLKTIRAMASPSGLFLVDLPSGDGGLVAFKTTNAAVLADLANRSFGGVVFPDNGPADLMAASTGAVSGSSVPLTSIQFLSGANHGSALVFRPLANVSSSTSTSPGYPDFTAAVSGYSANGLHANYATPSAIPGFFLMDGLNDTGRVVLGAMKYGGKVVAFGVVYNWGTTQLQNSGAFLLFEK